MLPDSGRPGSLLRDYACPACGGSAEVQDGHIYVAHKPPCRVLAAVTRRKIKYAKARGPEMRRDG